MDKHQKKAAIVSAAVAILAYSFVVYAFRLTSIGCIILAVCCLLFAFLFLRVNRWMKPYLNGKDYPNNEWYRKHNDRNYDVLILGDEVSRLRIPDNLLSNKKVFDLSLSNQNLYVDFLVLKNTFSIVKPQGIIYLPLRKSSIKYVNDKFVDERRYYWAISPYVFNPNPLSCTLKKIYKKIPGLLFRFKDLFYLLRKLFVPNQEALKIAKKLKKESVWLENTPPRKQNELKKIQIQMIDEMRSFCAERDLQLEIIDIE